MTLRRIAYVIKDFPKLSETFIAGELAELRRRGFEICVLSVFEPKETLRHRFIGDHGLDRLAVYGAGNFPAALAGFRPDLIHAHYSTHPTTNARALAARFGVPFTFTAHGFDIYFRVPPDFAEQGRGGGCGDHGLGSKRAPHRDQLRRPTRADSCDPVRRGYGDLLSARTRTASAGARYARRMRRNRG